MHHPDLGKSTSEQRKQADAETVAGWYQDGVPLTPEEQLVAAKGLELARESLLARLRQSEEYAINDMIEEGGPLIDNEQGENDD